MLPKLALALFNLLDEDGGPLHQGNSVGHSEVLSIAGHLYF